MLTFSCPFISLGSSFSSMSLNPFSSELRDEERVFDREKPRDNRRVSERPNRNLDLDFAKRVRCLSYNN